MNLKINNSIESIKKEDWQKLAVSHPFISIDFLRTYQKNQRHGIKHAYVHFDSDNTTGIAYANVFSIGGRQIHGYHKKNQVKKSMSSIIIGYFNLKIAALGNNFLTNIPSVNFTKIENPKILIEDIIRSFCQEYKVSKFIFPDHFFKEAKIEDPLAVFPKFIKLEVDEDMGLDIKEEWKSFEDYTLALTKKYRKRVKSVWQKSADVKIRELEKEEIETYKHKMQVLFDNVRNTSAFSSVQFNVESYSDLIQLTTPNCKVYGYFLDQNLVAFSSELTVKERLYSYFIGVDYTYNKSHSLYERILHQTIENAIKERKKHITFGRTAAEFKSNVGAVPTRSYIYVYFKNPLLRWLLLPVLSMMKPKKWIQRSPFK